MEKLEDWEIQLPPAEQDGGLDRLYRQYASWLRGRIRRHVGADQAEDIVQEAYLRAAAPEAAGGLRHPRAFLLHVAMNLIRDDHRRTQRRNACHQVGEMPAAVTVDFQAQAVLLKQVILHMPPRYRDVFVLSRFRGMTNAAISHHLKVPLKTVEWRMTKALAYCADRLRV